MSLSQFLKGNVPLEIDVNLCANDMFTVAFAIQDEEGGRGSPVSSRQMMLLHARADWHRLVDFSVQCGYLEC